MYYIVVVGVKAFLAHIVPQGKIAPKVINKWLRVNKIVGCRSERQVCQSPQMGLIIDVNMKWSPS